MFPQEPAAKWCSINYEDVVSYLLQYLEIDKKTLFFNFAVNVHGMSQDDVNEGLKRMKTCVEVADEFVVLLNTLFDKE